jgi:hypothetical protein
VNEEERNGREREQRKERETAAGRTNLTAIADGARDFSLFDRLNVWVLD